MARVSFCCSPLSGDINKPALRANEMKLVGRSLFALRRGDKRASPPDDFINEIEPLMLFLKICFESLFAEFRLPFPGDQKFGHQRLRFHVSHVLD